MGDRSGFGDASASVLVGFVEDEVAVEYGKFGLIDDDRVPPGEPGWLALPSPQTLSTGLNGAVFRSAGREHYAAVRLERWSGEPAPEDGDWDAVWDSELRVTSGRLRLVAVTKMVSETIFDLGGGGRYRLRVYCGGRAEVADSPMLVHGVERYVMRFWPAP